MLSANLKYAKKYDFLEKNILRCFEYCDENNLMDFEKGTYKIDGERIFVNVVEYKTQNIEDRFWEAHKKYIDIHVMIRGREKILLNSIDNLEQREYQEEGDFLPLEGSESSYVTLEKDDFLICYPEDAHMTAVKVVGEEEIKKAIFKVIIE